MKNLMKTSSLWAIALLPVLVGCTFGTFVDVSDNGSGTEFPRGRELSIQARQELVQAIKSTHYDALCIVKKGELVFSYGDDRLPLNAASVRKSIFSALYGIAIEKGIVDIEQTLEQLGVDDSKQPLTAQERQATLRHLLQARSGIYLKALGESEGMKKRKPIRGAYAPGAHYYYNNWDFNVLPMVLERLTGKTVGELIDEWLARPTGMTHFRPEHVTYQYADYTDYPQTRVYISAQDLARLGVLYAQGGRWQGRQVVPAAWVSESVLPVSEQERDEDLRESEVFEGYAYLWWVDRDRNTFWANGAGGQFMIVDPAQELVVVVRNNTGLSGPGVLWYEVTGSWESEGLADRIFSMVQAYLQE